MRILVTGGSGVLGSQVVQQLQARGHHPIILSRRTSTQPDWMHGDLASGEGLSEAIAGAEVVVHAASAAAEFTKIKRTDIVGTRRLVEAAEAARVKHLVYISIVGIDRIPYAYYKAKTAAEKTIKAGTVPWTILRATQFPELLDRVLRVSRGPFVFVPRSLSFQPVASAEVAERLADIATNAPAGMLEDFGGPEVLTTTQLAQAWLVGRGRRRRIVSLPILGRVGRGFRAGHHLCPDHRQGRTTWSDWIEHAYADGQAPSAYSRHRKPGDNT